MTTGAGEFIFVNIAPDSYKLQVTLQGFQDQFEAGVAVSPGDRVVVPTIKLEVGGAC